MRDRTFHIRLDKKESERLERLMEHHEQSAAGVVRMALRLLEESTFGKLKPAKRSR